MALTYIGRQPIFDSQLGVVGHELVCRAADVDVVEGISRPETVQSIQSSLIDLGFETLVGDGNAFVKVPLSFVEEGLYKALPPDRVVLEVLPCVADASAIESLERARVAGYQVALDGHPADTPLADHVDLVKLDVAGRDWDHLRAAVTSLHARRRRAIATSVETYDDLNHCRQAGFDLFQGFFFERPAVLSRRRLAADRLAAAQFLLELHRDDADVGVLADIVRRDAALTYRLLVVVNSSYYAVRQRIESIRQAIVLLGLQTIRNFASLLAITQVEGKPSELVTTAMVRGRMCELLAQRRCPGNEESAFLAGLLSMLDALMDAPLEAVVARISLSEQVEAALLGRAGVLGELLDAVEAYERDDRDAVAGVAVPEAQLMECYVEAVAWALKVRAGLEADPEPTDPAAVPLRL